MRRNKRAHSAPTRNRDGREHDDSYNAVNAHRRIARKIQNQVEAQHALDREDRGLLEEVLDNGHLTHKVRRTAVPGSELTYGDLEKRINARKQIIRNLVVPELIQHDTSHQAQYRQSSSRYASGWDDDGGVDGEEQVQSTRRSNQPRKLKEERSRIDFYQEVVDNDLEYLFVDAGLGSGASAGRLAAGTSPLSELRRKVPLREVYRMVMVVPQLAYLRRFVPQKMALTDLTFVAEYYTRTILSVLIEEVMKWLLGFMFLSLGMPDYSGALFGGIEYGYRCHASGPSPGIILPAYLHTALTLVPTFWGRVLIHLAYNLVVDCFGAPRADIATEILALFDVSPIISAVGFLFKLITGQVEIFPQGAWWSPRLRIVAYFSSWWSSLTLTSSVQDWVRLTVLAPIIHARDYVYSCVWEDKPDEVIYLEWFIILLALLAAYFMVAWVVLAILSRYESTVFLFSVIRRLPADSYHRADLFGSLMLDIGARDNGGTPCKMIFDPPEKPSSSWPGFLWQCIAVYRNAQYLEFDPALQAFTDAEAAQLRPVTHTLTDPQNRPCSLGSLRVTNFTFGYAGDSTITTQSVPFLVESVAVARRCSPGKTLGQIMSDACNVLNRNTSTAPIAREGSAAVAALCSYIAMQENDLGRLVSSNAFYGATPSTSTPNSPSSTGLRSIFIFVFAHTLTLLLQSLWAVSILTHPSGRLLSPCTTGLILIRPRTSTTALATEWVVRSLPAILQSLRTSAVSLIMSLGSSFPGRILWTLSISPYVTGWSAPPSLEPLWTLSALTFLKATIFVLETFATLPLASTSLTTLLSTYGLSTLQVTVLKLLWACSSPWRNAASRRFRGLSSAFLLWTAQLTWRQRSAMILFLSLITAVLSVTMLAQWRASALSGFTTLWDTLSLQTSGAFSTVWSTAPTNASQAAATT